MRNKLFSVGLCALLIFTCTAALAADRQSSDLGQIKQSLIVESGLFKPSTDAIFQRYVTEHRRPSGKAVLESAKGEAECFQVILPSYAGERLSLGAMELVSSSGYTMPSSALKAYRVGYVSTPQDHLLPDPLFDDLNMGDPKDPCVLWYTLTIPSDTPSGDYSGSVRFSVGAKSFSVPVRLKVWDFEIPKRGHLATDFWFFRGQIKHYYGRAADPSFREVSKYLEMALDHRLTPIDCCEGNVQPLFKIYREADGKLTIDWTEYDRYAQFVVDRGGTSLSLAPTHWFGKWFSDQLTLGYESSIITNRATGAVETVAYPYVSEKHLDMLKWYLREAVDHFRQKGWLEYAFVQPLDEVAENKETLAIVQACHDADPAVRVLMDVVTPASSKTFSDYLGIWCPLTPNLPGGGFDEVRAQGKDVWWYVCCGPLPPFANLFTNQACADHRQLFWQSWKYNSQGLLYWGINFWHMWGTEPKYDPKTAWPNSPAALGLGVIGSTGEIGDGYFIYPGPKGPIGSIRLEAIRDGLEDYEYLWLLNDRAKSVSVSKAAHAKSLLAIPESFCKDLEHYSSSEGDLTKLRREVASEIVKLKR